MTVVAIDGPAGSGKSTIAARLAQRLGVVHVDTGAYYRAAACVVLRAGVDAADVQAVLDVMRGVSITRDGNRTLIDGADVEREIRGPAVTALVSSVARHPDIRRHLVALQRAAVPPAGAVVEGRDAGTTVVPGADLKVWLTASPEERARRRATQLGSDDHEMIAEQVRDLQARDQSDARQMARADDAVEIDTTGRAIEDILDDIVGRITSGAPS